MTRSGETFRALHQRGNPFILANCWDRGSAKMLQSLGVQALATSSAAHAFTMGRPDGGTVTRDEALAHAADIVRAATVPVQGYFENGFGDDPETCADTVRLAAEIGLAGICIEDTHLPADAAYDFDLAVERIRAAVAASRALGADFVLTARADEMLTGTYDTDEAIRRLQAFADAGADCLYAPLPPDMAAQARICSAVDKPVNALAAGHLTRASLAEFAAAGVARISLGSSLARLTQRVIYDAATQMLQQGDFSSLSNGAPSSLIDPLLTS